MSLNIKERAKELKSKIPAVLLSLKDSRTPWYAKILAALTISYALSPIDLIPDFIPILGYLDDIIILPCLILLTMKLIPQKVWEENIVRGENLKLQKKWYYSLLIIAIYIILIICILIKIF